MQKNIFKLKHDYPIETFDPVIAIIYEYFTVFLFEWTAGRFLMIENNHIALTIKKI